MTPPKYTKAQYKETLRRTKASVESILSELDQEVMNNFQATVDIDFRHDVIPIIKALNLALKEIKISL
jgi:hypothetical protein